MTGSTHPRGPAGTHPAGRAGTRPLSRRNDPYTEPGACLCGACDCPCETGYPTGICACCRAGHHNGECSTLT